MSVNKTEVDKLCMELADRGKLIEAGFLSLRLTTIPSDAPEIQIREMRSAFFAGAQHLFGSIMGLLEGGDDATEGDIRRLSQISRELDDFIEQFAADNIKSGGAA